MNKTTSVARLRFDKVLELNVGDSPRLCACEWSHHLAAMTVEIIDQSLQTLNACPLFLGAAERPERPVYDTTPLLVSTSRHPCL